MQGSIREQMNRYPVFSCNSDAYIDESELFRDEEMKIANRNYTLKNRNDYKNQTIVSIYDRILSNNANDPLYVHARREKERTNYSTVTTARNSRSNLQTSTKKNDKSKGITRFMGQLASSIRKDESTSIDAHRTQKISLLKRIIQHYNVKSVERKYYSNLIKNFGLRIESVNSTDIAVKKNIHPRVNTSKNLHIQANEETLGINSQESGFENKVPHPLPSKKQSNIKKIGVSNSLMVKQFSLQYSRQDLKAKKNIFIREDVKLRGHISQKMRRSIEYSQKIFQKPLKIQSSTCIQDKVNKYRDFLFLINFSNHIYRNLDVERYEKSFKFFVGKGNNGNLIKSLMKKRFWFEEVSESNEADFVWTQIKIEQIFLKQEGAVKVQDLQQIQSIQLVDHMQQEEKKYEEIKNEIKQTEKMVANKNIKFGKYKTKAKDYAPQDPVLKVVSPEEAKKYKEGNESLAYKKAPTFADKFKSTTRKLKNQSSLTSFTPVHNHFPNNGLLGNKKALFYNIKQYCKLKGKVLSDFIPRTYHIRKGLTDEQYKQVSFVFLEKKKMKVPNYWIMKPGQFSNRGQGITCTNKLEDIRKRITKCRDESKTGRQSTLIVQEYITNPLLYNGRKFDIRVYMMITINNGKVKGYWYQEGYVRTSSFFWSLNEMQDKFIHLTNDAIQKGCEEYGRYEPGNKLTFNDLQRYLHTLPKCGRNMEFFDQIYPQMRRIASDVIKSVYVNLDPKRCRDNFQIFGLDFMIDENIKTWLIEVNTNPCLELNCPILERIIPHMVENAFRISLDPLFPPPSCLNSEYKYSIPENALHYNKFELVFDEDQDGEALRKLYQGSDIMQQMDDFQEDQQVYENEGNLLEINED